MGDLQSMGEKAEPEGSMRVGKEESFCDSRVEDVEIVKQIDLWAGIHPDLLNEFVKHVHSYNDYIRLRAVCKNWNLELPKISKHIRNPHLVLPFDNENLDTLHLEDNGDYCLKLPELHNTMLRGSCYGWLITVGIDGELQMLNPLTSVRFSLPPMSTIPDVISYHPNKHDEEYILRNIRNGKPHIRGLGSNRMQQSHLDKIILSSPPDDDNQDFIAMAIYGEFYRLAFCRFGDNGWTDVPTAEIYCGFEDVILHEGKVYAIDNMAQLYEFDLKSGPLLVGGISQVPPPNDLGILYSNLNNKYLIWNPHGDLLLAVRHLKLYRKYKGKKVKKCYRTSRFDTYKLDKSTRQWSRVFSLENFVIVVGFNSSICLYPFTDDNGNYTRNCIYFTDNMIESHYSEVIGGHDIGIFNLKDGSIKQLFPNSYLLWPPPVWLTG